ncbi:MAG TPA: hypothetical protein VK139_01345 [Microbacteriaceae bacterium]|nr:hypothetical protein [Microbacteriaceae bacterium]
MAKAGRIPSRREVMRPWELIIGSALAALFAGVIIFAGTRSFELATIATVGIFIVAVMVLAMCVLAIQPSKDEIAEIAQRDANAGS